MGQSKVLIRYPPAWAASVGAMMARNIEVMVSCSKCGYHVKPLPLEPIAEKFGLEFSLWDRRPLCRRCGTYRMHFAVSPGSGTPYTPMLS